MTFAFNPDGGLPRLIRYVGDLGDGVVALYDKTQNLLVIARPLFDTLSKTQKHRLLRTHEPVTVIEQRQTNAA